MRDFFVLPLKFQCIDQSFCYNHVTDLIRMYPIPGHINSGIVLEISIHTCLGIAIKGDMGVSQSLCKPSN